MRLFTKLIAATVFILIMVGNSFAFNAAKQVEFLISGSLKTDGSINSGGKVYTCDAGTVCGPSTSDPRTTWQDSNKVATHTNPVILDSLGTSTVFADGSYKFQIHDSDDTLIETLDNLEYTPEADSTAALGLTVTTITDVSNTVASTDDTVLCNATDDNVFTDMSAVSAIGNTGKRLTFKKIDSGSNSCTIDPLGSQTIDGLTTVVLATQYEDVTISSDGTNWKRIVSFDVEHKGDGRHDSVNIDGTLDTAGNATFANTVTISNTLTNDARVGWSKGADIASATILTLGTDGNYFDVTGTTDISNIASVGVGAVVRLEFDDAVTLINSPFFVMPLLSNVTTADGDTFTIFEYDTGKWRVTSPHLYTRSVSGNNLVFDAVTADKVEDSLIHLLTSDKETTGVTTQSASFEDHVNALVYKTATLESVSFICYLKNASSGAVTTVRLQMGGGGGVSTTITSNDLTYTPKTTTLDISSLTDDQYNDLLISVNTSDSGQAGAVKACSVTVN